MEPFQTHFNDYLSAMREAKNKGASHDYLRQVFIEFTRKSFGIDPIDVELEKGIRGATLRGSIDALYQDIVFEFKRDLKLEREKGKEELERYLRSLGKKQVFFGVLTDGIVFEAYLPEDDKLTKIDEANLGKLSVNDVFLWFDAFIFSERELVPNSQDVVKRFGDTSPVFNSSFHRLTRMFAVAKDNTSTQVKFNEWDKLLAKAYGHSVARADLFLRHTYLSLLAKLLAYAALFRQKPKGEQLREIITGRAFINLPNLAEDDFFCWVLASDVQKEALDLLRGLAQHLAIYDLAKVNQDLLKELYENLVDSETKHDLGEVYTPDWLVEFTLREAGFRIGKTLLDPACGSGTFLFTAIQMLGEQGLSGAPLVDEALENIVGVDVHPLAVTIAKVNYVLALANNLKEYGKTVVIPVYMADSLQAVGSSGAELVTIRAEGEDYFNIPRAMAEHPSSLDKVIDEMTRYISGPQDSAFKGFTKFLDAEGHSDWKYLWRPNLRLLRKLVEGKRDTIWAFILKNYYRPAYLRYRPFDIVAGNPPWLVYRHITDTGYQKQMKGLVLTYGLLSRKEVKLFTHMEEATLFFTLSADAFLKKQGTIAFVMPRSVLTGAKQHKRFQELLEGYQLPPMSLQKVLDVEEVRPLFKVPACVLIAQKDGKGDEVVKSVMEGILPSKNVRWSDAKRKLRRTNKRLPIAKLFSPQVTPSQYLKHIKQGATLVPRSLWFVQLVHSDYGIDRERPAIETSSDAERTADKRWRDIHLRGEVEAAYLYATLLGRQLLPFGFTDLSLVAIPLEVTRAGLRLVNKEEAFAKGHSGLHSWLCQAEATWEEKRKESTKQTVYQWLDYLGKLTSQRPTGHCTLVYNRAGTHLASCVLSTTCTSSMKLAVNGFVADADTYFYQTKDEAEVHYLCAFLNSDHVNKRIKGSQTRGAWGERDIHRRPFEAVSIPKFNPKDTKHQKLASLSQACHEKVAQLPLEGRSIGRLRNKVREHLSQELAEIDKLAREIITEYF